MINIDCLYRIKDKQYYTLKKKGEYHIALVTNINERWINYVQLHVYNKCGKYRISLTNHLTTESKFEGMYVPKKEDNHWRNIIHLMKERKPSDALKAHRLYLIEKNLKEEQAKISSKERDLVIMNKISISKPSLLLRIKRYLFGS